MTAKGPPLGDGADVMMMVVIAVIVFGGLWWLVGLARQAIFGW